MRRNGFTLIEVLTASALLTAALAMIWQAWMMANSTSDVIGKKLDSTIASAHALAIFGRELRQASRASLSPLPSATLSYRMVRDLDGNGLAVDALGQPELGAIHTLTRDHDDVNHDGLSSSQLVLIAGDHVEVLANGLVDDEVGDRNGDGREDRGLWFEAEGEGVLITIGVSRRTARKITLANEDTLLVTPRNP